MQKHANLVDLVKSFPTNIYLQNLASIQKRTSPVKFAHLAEKSENGSISNLSTKASTPEEKLVLAIDEDEDVAVQLLRTCRVDTTYRFSFSSVPDKCPRIDWAHMPEKALTLS